MWLAGRPTALLVIADLRLLTDPAFDTVGSVLGTAQPLVADNSQPIHAVLLSHHRHAEGLDVPGRRLFATVPMTLTTPAATDRMGRNATALPPWCHLTLDRPDGDSVTVAGVLAQHGPGGSDTRDRPHADRYRDAHGLHQRGHTSPEILSPAERFAPADLALLAADAAHTLPQDGYPVPPVDQAAEAATRLDARRVVSSTGDLNNSPNAPTRSAPPPPTHHEPPPDRPASR
jgi:L-ascorbate metabolism protein UlaG (beta-lactamase superfamily)